MIPADHPESDRQPRLPTRLWLLGRRNWRTLLLFLSLLVAASLVTPSLGAPLGWSWDFVEPLIGVATLLAAAGIWFGEKWQDYVDGLEKRLTVIFLYPAEVPQDPAHPGCRRIAILCEQAYLASESDLRAWSQQVAGNMVFDGALKFMPFIHELPGKIEGQGKHRFRHYHTIFELRTAPSPVDRSSGPESEECTRAKEAIGERRTICWLRKSDDTLEIRHDQTRWFDPQSRRILPAE